MQTQKEISRCSQLLSLHSGAQDFPGNIIDLIYQTSVCNFTYTLKGMLSSIYVL